MDDALAFRNHMAEQGYEHTPDHAAKILKYLEKFRKKIHKTARRDPGEIERLANLTLEEKQALRQQLAESGREVSLKELDELIELVLHVFEQEKM